MSPSPTMVEAKIEKGTTTFKDYLYKKIKNEMSKWNENDIYAVSFFVHSNESNKYDGMSNLSEFYISYNTEKDCEGAGKFDEERWNYAFWRQDETPIIDTESDSMLMLMVWYRENGVKNLGHEDEKSSYDKNGKYIGKGPNGHYELLQLASGVAKKLQKENYLKNKFGKEIPIIVHDLEYAWYDIEATKNANPDGEADVFIKAMEMNGVI